MDSALNSKNDISSDNLQAFLERLQSFNGPIHHQQLAGILKDFNFTEEELSAWISYDKEAYSRNMILRTEHVEVILMCWSSGQITPIHDHKGSACALKIIKGFASEINYEKTNSGTLVPVEFTRNGAGDVLSSYDEDTHQTANFEQPGNDLVTLHCYSPPLSKMSIFDSSSTFFGDYDQVHQRVCDRLKH